MSQVHPVAAQIAEFLAEKQPGRGDILSIQSTNAYKMQLQSRFLPWAFANGITDGHLTVEQWRAYVDELLGRDLSIHSVRTYLRGLRIFLVWLGVFRNLSREQRKAYWEPRAPKTLLEVLTREEIDRLEAATTNERDALIVRVLANTGIRLGELTRLRLKDLKLIAVPKTSTHYYRIRVWGKGSKEREVPIDKETYKRLDSYARAGGARTYIFPALQHDRKTGTLAMLDGPRLTNNTVDKMFREAKRAAGISKPCTPHKLRHAFATEALRRGVPPMQLKDMLGHSDLSMIVGVYGHLNPDDASSAYEKAFGAAERTEEPKKRRRIA